MTDMTNAPKVTYPDGRKFFFVQERTRRELSKARQVFDLSDDKGRSVGFWSSVHEVCVTLVADDGQRSSGALHSADLPTTYYEGNSGSLRDGEPYGPITRSVTGATISEVHDAMLRRCEESKKRATKKFATK